MDVRAKSLLLQSEADLLVTVVVAPVCKVFRTSWTLERAFASVHSLVGLPHVLVRELLLAELARVKVLANVDVPVHPHVVAGGVVLSTLNANVTLLTTGTWEETFESHMM